MDFLKKQINQQVLESHVELLNGVKDLQELSDIFIAINEECDNNLLFTRTKAKIAEPYEEMKNLIREISEISKETEYLRTIQRFLQIYTRLEPITNVEEYPRAALYIYEIDALLKEHELNDDENLETELCKYKEISEKVRKQGLDWIGEGLADNQASLAKGIQIYSNLQQLPEMVKNLLDSYIAEIAAEAHNTFDINSLNQEMTETKKQLIATQGKVQTSNLAAWAGILWSRTEKLNDSIYKFACNVHNLEAFLSRKKESISQSTYLDVVVLSLNAEVRTYFWKAVSTALDQEITAATKGSQFLRQVLEAGYPKLLRVFLELFNRVALLNNTKEKESNETTLLLKTLSSFESAYINRSSTRLLESVASIFPERNVVKSLSPEDANKFFRTISSELHAVKFDAHLLSLIMKNVVNADSPFSITGSIPVPVQLLKIDIINCLFALSDNIWGLLADYESSVIDDSIDKLTTTIVNQMTHIAEAIFLNLVSELQVVIAKVHKEDYKINKPPSLIQTGRPETSLYLHEYMAKVKWVFREFLVKLQCKEYSQKWILTFCDHLMHLQLLHVSIMPAGDQGKLKIASDLTQIEYVFAQSLSIAHIQLEDLKMSRQFKAYRKLLFLELDKVAGVTAVDYIFVCHYLLLYSRAIPFPTIVCGWSEVEYVQYLERHADMDIRKVMRKSMDLYLQHVEKEGLKETCIEFPVLRTVLSNWESSD
ncbi:hypothetical protein HDV06_004485 [Boothiomyces sp. JEL0866]|nr:hypothetical protein HDV06_004485 [Boothiomyces sp. JEL0866]